MGHRTFIHFFSMLDVWTADQYFDEYVNPWIQGLFEVNKEILDPTSVFARRGMVGVWRFCPNDLADNVEQLVRGAERDLRSAKT